MEYTFKNSAAEKACTVTVNDMELILHTAGASPESVPYSRIQCIRLFRRKLDSYYLYIYPRDKQPLVISNHYWLSATESEDRSRQYVTFVRVLHMYLKNKNDTEFMTGFAASSLMLRATLLLLTSIGVSFILRAMLPGLINTWVLAAALLAFLTLLLFILERNRLPQHYKASDIPLDYLP